MQSLKILKSSIIRSALTSVALLLIYTASGQAITWEVLFKKAEKKYEQGKYIKVAKKLKKFKKKELTKKYNSDSTLLGLAYIMEAKAAKAMAEFNEMEAKISEGLQLLDKYSANNPYAYCMGHLRTIDLYNEYGNHRKADSLLSVLQDLDPAFTRSDLLTMEISIREVLTLIENGYYLEADSLIEPLISKWEPSIYLSYSGEPITKQDQNYKKALLVYLYAARMKIHTERGDFGKAEELYKPGLKKAVRLVSLKSGAFTNYQLMEAYNYYAWKDYKKTEKLTTNLLKGQFAPYMVEEIVDLHAAAAQKNENLYSINTATAKQASVFRKSKTNKSYQEFKNNLNRSLITSSADQVRNRVTEFFTLTANANKFLPKDHPAITNLNRLAIAYATSSGYDNNFAAAEKFYIQLGNSLRYRYSDNAIENAIYRIAIAGYYLNHSETPSKAYKYLANDPSRLPMRQLKSSHPVYQRIVEDLREYYVLNGKYDYPIKLRKEVIAALKANPNVTGTELGKALVDLARLETAAGYYKDAETNIELALKSIRRDGEKKSEEYILALNSAAYLYGTIGLYDQAEKLLNKSTSLSKKLNIHNKEIKLASIEDLAFLYTRLGNYSETEELLNEVVKVKVSSFTENSFRLIKPYSALADLYLIKGEYPEAEKYIRKALEITRKTYGDSTLIYSEMLNKRVQLDLELGVYQDALTNANKVLQIRRNKLREDHILIGSAYQTLGNIYFYSSLDYAQAENFFLLARDVVEKNFNNMHPLYAEAIKNIAYLKVEKGEYDEALKLLEHADDIWSSTIGNKNRSSGEVARLKGDIYHFQGNFKQARKEYEKSLRYFKRIFNELHPDYLTTKSRLARAYYIEGDLKNAESLLGETTTAYVQYTQDYFPTLSEEEKAKFWNKIKPDFEFYNAVAVRLKDTKPKYLGEAFNFALITKGLLLSSSIKTRNSILNSGDPQLIALFEQWLANKEFLTSTLSQSDEELLENEIDPAKLKEETELLEKQLSEKSDEFAESFEYELYTWDDVKKVLNDHEAAVEIIRFREYDAVSGNYAIKYAALILTSDTRKNPEIVLFEDGESLEGKHFSLHRNSVEFKLQEDRSYQNFWKPIQDVIQNKQVVYFSPDGIFNQINVESLYMGDGKYVIDTQNVRVVNSTKSLAINRSKEAKKARKKSVQTLPLTAVLIGNPVYYSSPEQVVKAQKEASRSGADINVIPQLPGTENEVKTISKLLKSKEWNIDYLIGDAADETSIKKSQNKTLVHIATHGFFDEKPVKKSEFSLFQEDNPLDRSGLLAKGAGDILLKDTKNYNIDDGILTATEAMNLNFEDTELVVLSACETGRGKIEQGEGVFGLQRSFLVAGADAIVMSLFKVSDEVTQNLMIQFYKYWLEGDEKRVAFNKAQQDIKQQYPDPIYWGAFTMIAKM